MLLASPAFVKLNNGKLNTSLTKDNSSAPVPRPKRLGVFFVAGLFEIDSSQSSTPKAPLVEWQ
jgi:hypothetical protein